MSVLVGPGPDSGADQGAHSTGDLSGKLKGGERNDDPDALTRRLQFGEVVPVHFAPQLPRKDGPEGGGNAGFFPL